MIRLDREKLFVEYFSLVEATSLMVKQGFL